MKVLIAVISDLATDMRVQKQAALLAEMGCEVTVLGRMRYNSLPCVLPGMTVIRIRVPFRKGPGMYITFNFMLLIHLLVRRFDLCVSNDLDTLVPCCAVSRLFRKKLVYDAHEYFTGQHGLVEKRIRHRLWKAAERLTVPHVKHMITVSDSIAELYRSEYGANPVVVRNVAPPVAHLIPHDRSAHSVGEDELLVIYQGSGINEGRGAEELIDAMALVERARLIIAGSGDIIRKIRQRGTDSRAAARIIFLPVMPWDEMMRYTLGCDAGFSLDADTCTNQRYSLPNKLFDYIAAGIPAIASPLPEVSAVIRQYGCGVVLEEVSPEAIAQALVRLRDDRALLSALKEKSRAARNELNWEKEKLKEQEFFRSVIEIKESK
jgi:glycosyltransferase involved in cell wall biosynthesis